MSSGEAMYPRFLVSVDGVEREDDFRGTLFAAVMRGNALVDAGLAEFFTISRVDHGPALIGVVEPVPVYDSRSA